nr:glycosyltransferase family 2 protein [uncultured Acetatifactor sp.]
MVSFIVPVYNMEKYVERCMDSILNQQEQDWEVIAINDGSKDRTAEILNRYADRDDRIRVIHKENGGIGSAVKEGLQLAGGDYIAFVDSDDYIEKTMLSILKPFEGKYDIIQFNMVEEDEEGRVLGQIVFPEEEMKGTERILVRYFEKYRMPSMACRIFKRELFDGIEIEGRSIGIDEMVTFQLMKKAKSLISIESTLYHIYVRANSVSRTVYSKGRIEEAVKIHDRLWSYAEDLPSSVKKHVLAKIILAYLGMFAFCEKGIFQQEQEGIQKGLQAYAALARQEREWPLIRQQLGVGYRIYCFNSRLYRWIQQKRRV